MGPSAAFFLPPVIYDPHGYGFMNVSVAIADVNGDGRPDLLVANRFACSSCANGSVAVLLGNGDGTFQSAVTYDSGAGETESLVVADVNDDGKPDVVVGNKGGGGSSRGVGVLVGNGDGTFQAAVTYGLRIGGPDKIAVADVNGDGKLDVLALSFCFGAQCTSFESDGAVSVLLGRGDGTFEGNGTAYDSGGRQAKSMAVADVNGDGKLDLLVANQCTRQGCTQFHGVVGVLLGNGDGTFQPVVDYSGGNHTSGVAIADVNGDGNLDVLETDMGWSGVGVLLGNGDGTFQQRVGYATGGYSNGFLVIADINRDGKLDIVVPNEISSTVAVLLGNGVGTFQPAVTQAESDPKSLAVADLTGDGSLDLVVGTSDGNVTPLVGVMLHAGAVRTATKLVASLNPSIYGQKVTWTATVTSSGVIVPTGRVTFTWGYKIGSGILNSSGVVTLTRSNLNADPYPLIAVYSGDAANQRSTSGVLNQVVLQTTSIAALTSSPNPSTHGQAVTFTAKITSPTVIPKGPVTFTAGKTVLGTAQLSGGAAKVTISSLAVGSTKVTATYYGDSNISQSSASVTQTVH